MLPTRDAGPVTVTLKRDCGYGKAGETLDLPARTAAKLLRRDEATVTAKPSPQRAEKRTTKKASKKKKKTG